MAIISVKLSVARLKRTVWRGGLPGLPSLGAACLAAAAGLALAGAALGQDAPPVICPPVPAKVPEVARAEVYKNVPFKAGEAATYEVTWAGIKAGYATLEVRPPQKVDGIWQRLFHIDASTGDWFKSIFVAKEAVEALSRPADFGITRFYMEQNEGKLFSRPFIQQKWLNFDHARCKVHERIAAPGKAEENVDHDLEPGANDALGVVFNLRSRKFTLHKKERVLVYTSEKNWFLEADPQAFEKVTVPAGTFDTVKLQLQTYLGKDMQQKGDVFAWFSTSTPDHILVQIEGEIKIGSVWVKLHQLRPGG